MTMPVASLEQPVSSSELEVGKSILRDLTKNLGPREFAVSFPDGSRWEPEVGEQPAFTIIFPRPCSIRNMFWPPSDLTLGEAYMYGDFDVAGDMQAFVIFLRRLDAQYRSPWLLASLGWRLWRSPSEGRKPRVGHDGARLKGRLHSRARDRQAVGFHYDLSNEFFAQFLDPRMVYTSSYYEQADDTLSESQEQKLDYVCRKLRLRPGERLLDVGCGWGGLITFAAEHYGVEALGVTLSRAQVEFTQQEIDRRGLGDHCRVEYRDYRDIQTREPFDKIATVEVLEHAADFMMAVYFKKMMTLLRPGGALFVQAITLTGPKPIAKWRKFIRRYIFPDGKLRPVSAIQREAENAGFEVRDVESLREHYAMTLKSWLENLELRHDQAVEARNESTYRAFRLYLAGARYGYTSGVYNLHQALFAKPVQGQSNIPLTRADWYDGHQDAHSNGALLGSGTERASVG